MCRLDAADTSFTENLHGILKLFVMLGHAHNREIPAQMLLLQALMLMACAHWRSKHFR